MRRRSWWWRAGIIDVPNTRNVTGEEDRAVSRSSLGFVMTVNPRSGSRLVSVLALHQAGHWWMLFQSPAFMFDTSSRTRPSSDSPHH